MLQEFAARLPRFAKAHIGRNFLRMLPGAASSLMLHSHYYAHDARNDSYILPEFPDGAPAPGSAFAVPPSHLWVNYGRTTEEHLETGRMDVESMRAILARADRPIERADRILDFGCASGRLIRWLADLAPSREIWGVDIWATAIHWCKEHLSPPFHFATTTVAPHLPFEDRYFDLVYAGSVFTHIEDLADAWFLELRRILRPGGSLYFTLNDRSAIEVFEGKHTPEEFETYCKRVAGQENWKAFVDGYLRGSPEYRAFRRGEAQMVTLHRSAASNVIWDVNFLHRRQQPFWQALSVNARAYGHQTGVLWARV